MVGFRGRERLLDELQAWCGGSGFAAWLLHGTGGQGKTRVAQELATLLAEQRWASLWLRGDAPTHALDVLADVAVPLLLVVDYAETRTEQVAAALRACAGHGGGVPLRMLLLARTAGDWWDALQGADPHAEHRLDGAPTVMLPELEPDPSGRVEAYRQAVTDLARTLAGLPGQQGHHWPRTAGRLAAAAVDPGRPVSALTLHMTALADLLDTANPASDRAVAGGPAGVEDRLLRHERRYWQATAADGQDVLQHPRHLRRVEVDLLRMRTREGMAVARARGKLRGKQPKLSTKQQAHLVHLHGDGDHSIADLAELFSVSRATVYCVLDRARASE